MKPLDRVLQQWRIAKAAPHVPPGCRLLDVGCADGILFRRLTGRIREGVGIDPDLAKDERAGLLRLFSGRFPDDLPEMEPFDVITMLAVFEHFPPDVRVSVVSSCARFLKPGGRVILTIPSPVVDHLLHFLQRLHLLDGMDVHEHCGYEVRDTPRLFAESGFALVTHRRFQVGLNHLFVFRRDAAPG